MGVCVETRLPMCAECSTRYDGVNYSKAGLAQMLERTRAGRVESARRSGRGDLVLTSFLLVLAPVLFVGAVVLLEAAGQGMIDLVWMRVIE